MRAWLLKLKTCLHAQFILSYGHALLPAISPASDALYHQLFDIPVFAATIMSQNYHSIQDSPSCIVHASLKRPDFNSEIPKARLLPSVTYCPPIVS